MALNFGVLLEVREHHDQRHSLLVYHSPKVLNGDLQWALRCYEKLIVSRDGSVDVVCIDVAVVDVLVALDETHSCVLERL